MKLHHLSLAIIVGSINYGCASNLIDYSVTSNPPRAPIEVNGIYKGKTPTNIKLKCTETWVGIMSSPTGFSQSKPYTISAHPPNGLNGNKKTKIIQPCDAAEQGSEALYFKFDSYSGLSTGDIANILGVKNKNDEIKIIKDSLNYNDTTKLGSLSTKTDIYDRNEVIKIIENICSTKNIALKAGSNKENNGAVYKTHDEHLVSGILTINFQCLY